MTDMTAAPAAGEQPQTVDEFLGTSERPRWKRWAKYWVPALVVVLLALYFFRGGEAGPEYITEEVVERSLDIEVTATGNLRPTNQVDVGSEVSGRIDRVLVDVNDRVARGQVLAQINTDVIEDQIKQARANVNSARASVAQARATLDVDTAQLARLQEVYRVSDGKVPSRTELEAAEANVARDKASVNSAQASVASAEAQLSSAITNRDRAVIRSPVSGVVLARQIEPGQTVAASFNTPTLFVIAEDLSQMQLRVSIDEADVGQIKAGQKATFTVDAYPGREFPATVERIALASNNTATSTQQQQQGQQGNAVVIYEARLTVNNPNGLLRPGMTATANVATESTGKRMLVPNGALRFEPPSEEQAAGVQVNDGENFGLDREEERATIGRGSRQTVQVLQDDGTLKPVEVVTGQSDGRYTVVTSDELEVGMKVVTSVKADAG
jgi:HlyD family secretion protein